MTEKSPCFNKLTREIASINFSKKQSLFISKGRGEIQKAMNSGNFSDELITELELVGKDSILKNAFEAIHKGIRREIISDENYSGYAALVEFGVLESTFYATFDNAGTQQLLKPELYSNINNGYVQWLLFYDESYNVNAYETGITIYGYKVCLIEQINEIPKGTLLDKGVTHHSSEGGEYEEVTSIYTLINEEGEQPYMSLLYSELGNPILNTIDEIEAGHNIYVLFQQSPSDTANLECFDYKGNHLFTAIKNWDASSHGLSPNFVGKNILLIQNPHTLKVDIIDLTQKNDIIFSSDELAASYDIRNWRFLGISNGKNRVLTFSYYDSHGNKVFAHVSEDDPSRILHQGFNEPHIHETQNGVITVEFDEVKYEYTLFDSSTKNLISKVQGFLKPDGSMVYGGEVYTESYQNGKIYFTCVCENDGESSYIAFPMNYQVS